MFSKRTEPKSRIIPKAFGIEATVVQLQNKAAWSRKNRELYSLPGGSQGSCLDFGACADVYRELLFVARQKVTAETIIFKAVSMIF
jgi:hypothetical protein